MHLKPKRYDAIMKLRNRNQRWSDKDVYILVRLMREQVPHKTIAAILGRSEASLRHAIKNTLYQQLLHHMPRDVMMYYNMKDNELYQDVVNPVYYQELETMDGVSEGDDASDESYEPDSHDDDCDSEGCNDMSNTDKDPHDETQESHHSETCHYIVTSIFTFLIVAGASLYVSTVKQNWIPS